jgi:acetyltransferase-like isoleucine patch superfamily enzyme
MINNLANIVGELIEGENCRIDPFVTITGRVKLGNNVHIGVGACIFGSEGVEIGNDCSISPGAKIFTGSYDSTVGYLANPQVIGKKYQQGPVKIGNRSIVGANSVVLPGVTIGDDVLVGALSLVKRSIDSGNIAVGTAGKLIKRNL